MTNLISDAFIQAKELVMKAMGELVADGLFQQSLFLHLIRRYLPTQKTVTFPLMPQWYVQDLSETIQEK